MAIEPSSRARRWLSCGLLLGQLTSLGGKAHAEDATDAARAHYDRGYRLASEGVFEAAIAEFERAYTLSPNYSVLFNLAQAYGAAGRAVKAAHTLERYLELGGANVDLEQRRRVAELIAAYRRRIGKLGLEVRPAGAEVTIDGQRLADAPAAGTTELEAGTHGLVVTAEGFLTFARSVTITSGETTHVEVALSPRTGASSLELACSIPDVRVNIDGVERARTPLSKPLLLKAGRHELVLFRSGYETETVQLELEPDKSTRYACALKRDPGAVNLSRLAVEHPLATRVTLDGAPFRGEPLVPGRHLVAVEGGGFESRELGISLAPSRSLRLRLVPSPARQTLERSRERRAYVQRVAAYAVGGVAIASGAVAVGLAVSNAGRYQDWREKNRQFLESHADQSMAATARALDQLLAEENSIRNRDALVLGMGVAAGTLLATSIGLWLTSSTHQPTLTVTGSGAQLGYGSSF